MDRNKVIFCGTLAFSVVLEWFIRKGAVILYGTNGFNLWPWVDNFMHFAWGFNIFLFFLLILKWQPLDALLAVFAWQMLWEAIEIVGDRLVEQPDFMFDHFFYDGIKDTVVDLLGALFGWKLFGSIDKKSKPMPFRNFLIKYVYAAVALCIVGSAWIIYQVSAGYGFSSPDIFAVVWLVVSALVLAGYELLS